MRVVHWGITEYDDALRRQHELVAARLRGEVPDTLVLTEHSPVITLGRGTRRTNVLDPRFPVVEVERGGDVTFHGPGQLVGYVVRLLPPGRRDLHAWMRAVEQLLIDALSLFGIRGERIAGKTGVWVGPSDATGARKIASLGIAARNWCTFHGFALNVTTNLADFRAINPCGFDASVMTSVARELGRDVRMSEVAVAIEQLASR